MQTPNPLITQSKEGSVAVIALNHPNRLNPISMALNDALCQAMQQADTDSSIDAIVLTGGKGRSFSAGGDFKETSVMRDRKDVVHWIDHIIALYISVLRVSKPVIAALDGHAIGMGFQLALCADWRTASEGARLTMVELEKGIACTLGSAMLQHSLGRLLMTHIVYGCAPIDARAALALGVVDEIAPPEQYLEAAIASARKFAAYPPIPFRRTKAAINARMIDVIGNAAETSRAAHSEGFAIGAADPHFRKILGKSE